MAKEREREMRFGLNWPIIQPCFHYNHDWFNLIAPLFAVFFYHLGVPLTPVLLAIVQKIPYHSNSWTCSHCELDWCSYWLGSL